MHQWIASYGPCHDWHWTYMPEFPNGWTAGVSDVSKTCAPEKPTEYHICSTSRLRIMQGQKRYATLEEAKREAIRLTLSQPQAAQTTEELLSQQKGNNG